MTTTRRRRSVRLPQRYRPRPLPIPIPRQRHRRCRTGRRGSVDSGAGAVSVSGGLAGRDQGNAVDRCRCSESRQGGGPPGGSPARTAIPLSVVPETSSPGPSCPGTGARHAGRFLADFPDRTTRNVNSRSSVRIDLAGDALFPGPSVGLAPEPTARIVATHATTISFTFDRLLRAAVSRTDPRSECRPILDGNDVTFAPRRAGRGRSHWLRRRGGIG